MMTNFSKYVVTAVAACVVMLVYGLAIGGNPPEWLLLLTFALCILLLAFLHRKQTENLVLKKVIKLSIAAAVAVCVALTLYGTANRSTATPIRSYTTTATTVLYTRGSNTVYFNDPDEIEKSAEYFSWDNLKVIVKDNSGLQRGDTVQVTEYRGLFGVEYGVLTRQYRSSLFVRIKSLSNK